LLEHESDDDRLESNLMLPTKRLLGQVAGLPVLDALRPALAVDFFLASLNS